MWMCLEWVGLTAFAVETRERESLWVELLRTSSWARESVGEMFSSFRLWNHSTKVFLSLPSLSTLSIVQEDSWSGRFWWSRLHSCISCYRIFSFSFLKDTQRRIESTILLSLLPSIDASVCLVVRSHLASPVDVIRSLCPFSLLCYFIWLGFCFFLQSATFLWLLLLQLSLPPIVRNCISFSLSLLPHFGWWYLCVMCQDVDTSCGSHDVTSSSSSVIFVVVEKIREEKRRASSFSVVLV